MSACLDPVPTCPGPVICDLAREMLAVSELELLERLASREADVTAYRAALLEAIAALRALTVERDRLRAREQQRQDDGCPI